MGAMTLYDDLGQLGQDKPRDDVGAIAGLGPRTLRVYRAASLIRKRVSLRPYGRPVMVLEGGRCRMGEGPLYERGSTVSCAR